APPALEPRLVVRQDRRRPGRLCRGLAPEPIEKLPDSLLRIQADFPRIRPHEGPAEDAARQLRNVVALERLERAGGNLRARGNLPQRDAAPLARLTELPAKIARGRGSAMCGQRWRSL